MIVSIDKKRKLHTTEIIFRASLFQHLTGCSEEINGRKVRAEDFYNHLIKNQISDKNFIVDNIQAKAKMTILPTLMQIDKTANMIGDYNGIGQKELKTEKVTGNVIGCLGLIKTGKNNSYYVPNSTIKRNTSDITNNYERVVAIFKKYFKDKFYNELTYLKNGVDINRILEVEDIKGWIDIEKIMIDKWGIKIV